MERPYDNGSEDEDSEEPKKTPQIFLRDAAIALDGVDHPCSGKRSQKDPEDLRRDEHRPEQDYILPVAFRVLPDLAEQVHERVCVHTSPFLLSCRRAKEQKEL